MSNSTRMMPFEQTERRVHQCLLDMDSPRYTKAVQPIMFIIAHESKGGQYWQQLGGGPALGIIQMEPWVHDDVWEHCDNISVYAERLGFGRPDVELLKTSFTYNIFMARMRLLMDINPLPEDDVELSRYLKEYWNSEKGKADGLSYLNDWKWWKDCA